MAKYVDPLESALNQLKPDYYWDFDNWDCTYEDTSNLLDNVGVFEIVKIGTAKELPPKWVVGIPLSFDENGDWLDWEHQWFNTLDEAKQAKYEAEQKTMQLQEAAEQREKEENAARSGEND